MAHDFINGGFKAVLFGLGGFLLGFALQLLAQAAKVSEVSSVPVIAILPIFTIGAAILGFFEGMYEKQASK